MDGYSNLEIATTLSAVALLGLVVHSSTKRSRSRSPFPPGPKPLPLIGNVLDIPHEKEWLVYNQLTQKHGAFIRRDRRITEELG